MGKWDESMSCIIGDDASKVNSRNANQSTGATLLWEKNVPPANPTRYNLSSFAITLNELTPGLKVCAKHIIRLLLVFCSAKPNVLFDDLLRRSFHQRIQDSGQISGI